MSARKVSRGLRAPAFGIAILTPVLLAGAVAASPDRPSAPSPVAAAPSSPAVRAAAPAPLQVAAPAVGLRIPATALSAYRKAERTMATAAPGCGLSWNLLAGIGRIEASPANGGETAVRAVSARTGTKKLPSATWARFASDGDGDGTSDPRNPFDATLATARHLCSSGMNFRNQSQVLTALLRYNDSMAFAQNVMGWAAAYATGTAPLNLPPIYGTAPVGGPYLPSGIWGLPQATLVAGTGMQAGYLLPRAAAAAPNAVLPEPAPLPAPVIVPELPRIDPPAAAVAAPVGSAPSAVAPQVALQGDRPRPEPTQAYTAPPPPPVTVPEIDVPEVSAPQIPDESSAFNGGGRQAGRTQIDSAPQAPVSSPALSNNDGGGGNSSGGARRGGRGNG